MSDFVDASGGKKPKIDRFVVPLANEEHTKETKIKFSYTEKYRRIRMNGKCRRDTIHECIWSMLRLYEKKGYIKVESIISF
jgi:hypothetical protein